MVPTRFAMDHTGPAPRRRPPPTPLGSILVAGVFVGLPCVASYPVASGITLAATLFTVHAARTAVERLRRLGSADGVGSVCIPGTDVCLGA